MSRIKTIISWALSLALNRGRAHPGELGLRGRGLRGRGLRFDIQPDIDIRKQHDHRRTRRL